MLKTNLKKVFHISQKLITKSFTFHAFPQSSFLTFSPLIYQSKFLFSNNKLPKGFEKFNPKKPKNDASGTPIPTPEPKKEQKLSEKPETIPNKPEEVPGKTVGEPKKKQKQETIHLEGFEKFNPEKPKSGPPRSTPQPKKEQNKRPIIGKGFEKFNPKKRKNDTSATPILTPEPKKDQNQQTIEVKPKEAPIEVSKKQEENPKNPDVETPITKRPEEVLKKPEKTAGETPINNEKQEEHDKSNEKENINTNKSKKEETKKQEADPNGNKEKKHQKKHENEEEPEKLLNIWSFLTGGFIIYFLFSPVFESITNSYNLTYSDFVKNYIDKNIIEKITVNILNENSHFTAEARIFIKNSDKTQKLLIGNLDYFLENLEKYQLEEQKKSPSELIPISYAYPFDLMKFIEKFMTVNVGIASILLGIFFFKFAKNVVNRGKKGNDIFGSGKSNVNMYGKDSNIKTKFKDVAGLDEAKLEISEFVEFLKNPKKYQDIGARLPRGALLSGPPGTGKTMLAKACAGEAGVPFFYMAGSDFVEVFVGVGAARVRDLFTKAKKKSPSIIFLDEIDAVGKKRESKLGGNDERENTLNQLLVEMDGFGTDNQVVVLAATNRIELLDTALTRPGRFDRTIEIPLPDIEGRFQIFLVHLEPLKLNPERTKVDYAKRLSTLTPGFSGADIGNLCNEAAIIAARKNKKSVDSIDFEMATERVLAGLEKNKIISEEERKIVAYHESGHAVVSWFLEGGAPLLKLTIIPRSKGSLGYAQYLPNESSLETKEELLDRICCILGGRCSEEFFFKKVTTGAYDDLEKVFKLAHSIVTKFGMSDKVGFMGYSETDFQKNYSDGTQKIIDLEIKKIVDECTEKTLKITEKYKNQISKLATVLLEKETLDLRAIITILGNRPFAAKSNFKAYLESKNTQDIEIKNPEVKPSNDESLKEKPATESLNEKPNEK